MRFTSPATHETGLRATWIDLFGCSTPQMRAFHVTWTAFFVCFVAGLAAAPPVPLSGAHSP